MMVAEGNFKKTDNNWSYIPIIRKSDKTIVHFQENFEGIPLHVTIVLDKEGTILSKSAIPLSEICG